MEKQVSVPDVSCGHCAASIRNELSALPGVGRIEVDVAAKRLTVGFDAPATWEAIVATLAGIGFPPQE